MTRADAALRVRLVTRPLPGSAFRLDVELELPPGITVLTGPSGAGKSTLLSAIAGLVPLESGRISLGEEVWFDSATRVERPPHARGVGLVFQSLALFPHLTALGNVEYGIDRRRPAVERRRRAGELLERMRVSHLGHRRPASYSGGEAQRVALARALAREPRVLLLDEAFDSLDPDLRDELHQTVETAVGELGTPTLLVTHDAAEAARMGSRGLRLRGGHLESAPAKSA